MYTTICYLTFYKLIFLLFKNKATEDLDWNGNPLAPEPYSNVRTFATNKVENNPLLEKNSSYPVERISEEDFNQIEFLMTQGYSKENAIQFILQRKENYQEVSINLV